MPSLGVVAHITWEVEVNLKASLNYSLTLSQSKKQQHKCPSPSPFSGCGRRDKIMTVKRSSWEGHCQGGDPSEGTRSHCTVMLTVNRETENKELSEDGSHVGHSRPDPGVPALSRV